LDISGSGNIPSIYGAIHSFALVKQTMDLSIFLVMGSFVLFLMSIHTQSAEIVRERHAKEKTHEVQVQAHSQHKLKWTIKLFSAVRKHGITYLPLLTALT